MNCTTSTCQSKCLSQVCFYAGSLGSCWDDGFIMWLRKALSLASLCIIIIFFFCRLFNPALVQLYKYPDLYRSVDIEHKVSGCGGTSCLVSIQLTRLSPSLYLFEIIRPIEALSTNPRAHLVDDFVDVRTIWTTV